MGYLTPAITEEDYDNGTGSLTLTLTNTPEEDDIFLMCVEYSGNGTPPSITGWTTVAGPEASGTGFDDSEVVILAHRYDGSNLPSFVCPDTGNHQSASLLIARDIDRDLAIADIHHVAFSDSSADTNTKSNSTSPATESADVGTLGTGQKCAVLWFTGGSEPHGGASHSAVATGGWSDVAEIRSGGHAQGSGGSHFTAWGNATSAASDLQHSWSVTNSMEESRVAIFLPGHEYTEFTRSISDGVGSSESLGRDADMSRSLAESLSASDALSSLSSLTRAIADALSSGESMARVVGAVRSATDSVSTSEALARVVGFVQGVTDSLGTSEAITQLKILYRNATDSLGASESLTRAIFKYRNITESLSVSDAITDTLLYGIRAAIKAAINVATRVIDSVSTATSIEDDVEVPTRIIIDINEDIGTDITDVVDTATDIEVTIE